MAANDFVKVVIHLSASSTLDVATSSKYFAGGGGGGANDFVKVVIHLSASSTLDVATSSKYFAGGGRYPQENFETKTLIWSILVHCDQL